MARRPACSSAAATRILRVPRTHTAISSWMQITDHVSRAISQPAFRTGVAALRVFKVPRVTGVVSPPFRPRG